MSHFSRAVVAVLLLFNLTTLYTLAEISNTLDRQDQQVGHLAASLELSLRHSVPSRIVYPDDLRPGLEICKTDQRTTVSQDYLVQSTVYEMPRGEDKGGLMQVVDVQPPYGATFTVTLADLGILPYPGGVWEPSSLTLLGECHNN